MLTYSFSRREKALILALALMLVAVAWYVLVFQHTSSELASLDGQIADAESELTLNQARVAQIDAMKAAIADHEAAGERPVEVPDYDNMTPLTAELNSVLAAAETYSVSFDELDVDSGSGFVQRGVKVDFGCGSYDIAKAIVNTLANGTFPCIIDTVSITDNTVSTSGRSSSGTGSNVSASLHLTYLERR